MSVTHAVRGPLVLEQLIARVSATDRGATASFLGTVRAGPDDGLVIRIEYSAYEAMLDAEFERITAEAAARWPGVAVAAQHRLGTVPLGDASIAIAVAAPHRAAALDACRFVIEEAKRRLPVWKREVLADGTTAWRDNEGGRVPGRPTPTGPST
jgi:molybdopterin synthase catalytic subunit